MNSAKYSLLLASFCLIASSTLLSRGMGSPTVPPSPPASPSPSPLPSAKQGNFKSLTVNPSRSLGSNSSGLMGTNVLYHEEPDAVWDGDTVPNLLKELRIRFLRYPGGTVINKFHWNYPDGNGFALDDWDPASRDPITNKPLEPSVPPDQWMDIQEYMKAAKASGAEPLVGINILSGYKFGHKPGDRNHTGLAEAAALIKYLKQHYPQVQTVFLGNENNKEIPDAATYARLIGDYTTTIHSINNGMKIVINWSGIAKNSAGKNSGIGTILKKLAEDPRKPRIDYLDFHAYWEYNTSNFPLWTRGRSSNPDNYSYMTNYDSLTYVKIIQDFRAEIAKFSYAPHLKNLKLVSFEWNVGPGENGVESLSRYESALIDSEMFMQFINGGLEAAAYWPLHLDTNSYYKNGNISQTGQPPLLNPESLGQTPHYKMLRFYRSLLGKSRVYVSEEAMHGLISTAAYNPNTDTTTIMMIEKGGEKSNVHINLQGFKNPLWQYALSAQSFHAPNDVTSSSSALIENLADAVLDAPNAKLKVQLRPYSLTKIILKHEPKPPPPPPRPTPTPTVRPSPTPTVTPTPTPTVRPSPTPTVRPTPTPTPTPYVKPIIR